jgi:hypothetical protein
MALQEFIASLDLNHDTYYSQKTAGNLPRLEDALQIAQTLETTVEYLVIGINPKPLTESQILNEAFMEIQGTIDKYWKNPGKPERKKP